MTADPRRQLGERAERLAARELRRRGYRLVARNWRCSLGEIDLLAEEAGDLVVVEVKARLDDRYGGPEAAVGPAKQRKLSRLLDAYLLASNRRGNARFDVVALVFDQRGRLANCEVYRNAFDYLD